MRRTIGVAALTMLLALGTAGLATTAMAAGEKGTDYEWSIELDCSKCHQKECASLGLLEAETDEAAAEAAEEAAEEAADTDAVKATGEADGSKEGAEARSNVTVELSEEELAHLAEVTAYGPMHAENFGLTCTTCHQDSDELAAGHKKLNNGKEAKRLKKSTVSSEICVTCHPEEDLVEATADYVALVDGKGTVVNPHDRPDVESHEGIQCMDCHTVHSGKQIQEAAMTTCLSCHHAGVFECNTCH